MRTETTMMEPFAAAFPKLQELVAQRLAASPDCHGLDHTQRVWRNARRIALVEGADLTVVEYAAWLHDIGRVAEFADGGKTCHAEIGGVLVPLILEELGLTDPDFIARVASCVRRHRYRARDGMVPMALEEKVIYDADKLDSMGAMGIGRAFHFAGRIGARVHNTDAEALGSSSYSHEDTAYREFLVKLRHLHEALLTEEGRRMGQRRHATMIGFFEELNQEAAAKDAMA